MMMMGMMTVVVMLHFCLQPPNNHKNNMMLRLVSLLRSFASMLASRLNAAFGKRPPTSNSVIYMLLLHINSFITIKVYQSHQQNPRAGSRQQRSCCEGLQILVVVAFACVQVTDRGFFDAAATVLEDKIEGSLQTQDRISPRYSSVYLILFCSCC